jgi:hypothetical protein
MALHSRGSSTGCARVAGERNIALGRRGFFVKGFGRHNSSRCGVVRGNWHRDSPMEKLGSNIRLGFELDKLGWSSSDVYASSKQFDGYS